MAILVRSMLLLAAMLFLCLLPAPTASARPLKTLFITFSIDSDHIHHHHHHNPNPNSFIFIDSQNPTDSRFITILSDKFIDRPVSQPFSEFDRPLEKSTPFGGLFRQSGIDFDSMMDWSKDVFSVVVALLFGVGCGALTTATMYFAWMLIVGEKEDCDEEIKEGFYCHYDEIMSPRKGEYTKIPKDAAAAAAAAAPAQAKDVV